MDFLVPRREPSTFAMSHGHGPRLGMAIGHGPGGDPSGRWGHQNWLARPRIHLHRRVVESRPVFFFGRNFIYIYIYSESKKGMLLSFSCRIVV